MHPGIGRLEPRHHLGQCIPRLRVGGGDGELALVGAGELLRQALDVAQVLQHAVGHLRHFLAGLGQPQQSLAATLEQFHAQLILQVLDVLADPGLRREQRRGHFGQIEVLLHRFTDDAQLLEVHARDVGLRRPG